MSSFIPTYTFRAILSRPALMDFIARMPPENYVLLPQPDCIYGIIVSDEAVDFFLNEFTVASFELVPISQIVQLGTTEGQKCWGNRDLLNG
jgi:hypothetical protein